MYQNRKITKKLLKDYEELIPPNYLEQIKLGKFYPGEVIDIIDEKEMVVAVYITYSFDNWLEIVWVHAFNETAGPLVKADILRYVVRTERLRISGLKGAFFEIHTDEVKNPVAFRHTLMMAGFESRETPNNIYELSLGQIKEQAFLKKAAGMMNCITVKDADERVLEKIDALIQDDPRPVPVGLFTKWDDYLAEDSLICFKDKVPCGVLLISKKSDYLVLECAYVNDKLALSVMVGRAYFMAEKKYGADQKILVPVVLSKTGLLVEKLAPETKRGRLIEGIMWF